MYEFAPLAPQIWGEQPFQSPPKLGDLGGINMINKIKFIFQFSSATITFRQPERGSVKMKRLAVPLRSYSQSNDSGCPGLAGSRVRGNFNQLHRFFIHTNHGMLGVIGSMINFQHILHLSYKFSIPFGWNDILLTQMGLSLVFLSSRGDCFVANLWHNL